MHGTQFPTCTHLYGNLHYEARSTKYFRVTWHALLFMEYGNRVSLVPLVSLEFPRSGANLNVKQLPLIQGGILARTTIAFQVTLNHRNHQNEPCILIKILSEISKPGCTSSEPSSLGPQTHRRAMCLKILRRCPYDQKVTCFRKLARFRAVTVGRFYPCCLLVIKILETYIDHFLTFKSWSCIILYLS